MNRARALLAVLRRPPVQLSLLVALLLASLAITVTASAFLTDQAIGRSERQWCVTLELVTSQVPRPGTSAYQFYRDFRELERRFGC